MTGMDEPEEGSVFLSTPEEQWAAARTVWLSRNPGKTEADFTRRELHDMLWHMAELEYLTGYLLYKGEDNPGDKTVMRTAHRTLNWLMDGADEPAWLALTDEEIETDPLGPVHRVAWAAGEVADWVGYDESTPDWLRHVARGRELAEQNRRSGLAP